MNDIKTDLLKAQSDYLESIVSLQREIIATSDEELEFAKVRVKTDESELQAANASRDTWKYAAELAKSRIKALEDGIREHWQESTHGITANMQLADDKLHRLIGCA